MVELIIEHIQSFIEANSGVGAIGAVIGLYIGFKIFIGVAGTILELIGIILNGVFNRRRKIRPKRTPTTTTHTTTKHRGGTITTNTITIRNIPNPFPRIWGKFVDLFREKE